MWMESFGKFKESTSPGLETATFWPVAQCLKQLGYRSPL
jgi:hypothetical protein